MDIRELICNCRRQFSIAVALIGAIPLLVCVYLVSAKLSSTNVLAGQVGFVIFTTIIIFIGGVLVGKKMFDSITAEVIEKSRLAAITETVLGIGDQVNNPLMVARGNLEILEMFALENKLPTKQLDRIKTVKDKLEHIRQITENVSKLASSRAVPIYGKTKMVDLSENNYKKS